MQVKAVIKGQTKKQMIKFCMKTNFEQFFFIGFYHYLKVKPPKTVIHINASGRCIFRTKTNENKFFFLNNFVITILVRKRVRKKIDREERLERENT